MGKIQTRYIVAVVIILATAGMVNYIEYDTFYQADDAIRTIKNIPINLGRWRGNNVFLDEDVYEILETRAIIHRNYQLEDQRVFLSLVFYPETKVDFHAPEACFGGTGLQVEKSAKTITFENAGEEIKLDLNQLVYYNEVNKDLVYYFFKAGSFVGNSYVHLRLSLAGNKISGNGTSGALIRISTPDNAAGNVKAADRLKSFLKELYPYIIQYL